MSEKNIFNHIKKLNFNENIYPIINLLEKNKERIEYVKDHVGLHDLLFIAEKEAHEFEFKTFCCLDVKVNYQNYDKNFIEMNKCMVHEYEEVLHKINNFFESTERTLYVMIGFKESVLQQEDMFNVYDLLINKEATNTYEAIAKIRRFPNWYQAKHPTDIFEFNKNIELITEAERLLLKKRKNDLLDEIEHALSSNDKETFIKLTNNLKTIEQDLNLF